MNPFDDLSKWTDVTRAFNQFLLKTRPNALEVNSRSTEERVEKLLKAFKSQEMESLRR